MRKWGRHQHGAAGDETTAEGFGERTEHRTYSWSAMNAHSPTARKMHPIPNVIAHGHRTDDAG